jgi:hypothetical protein
LSPRFSVGPAISGASRISRAVSGAIAPCIAAGSRPWPKASGNICSARGQSEQPQQAERLARLVLLAQTARLWVEASSAAVERAAVTAGDGVAAAVTQGLLARQAVETACLEGIALTERAMGTAAFAASSDVDRIRRDLGFFLRQANLDGKLQQAAQALLADPAPVGEMW